MERRGISIFCDESCHLEHDRQKAMVLGGVWCADVDKQKAYERIREIKKENNLPADKEVKWTKISNKNVSAYLDLVNYFFDNSELHFRCVVIPNKDELNHEKYNQTHNDWYYKMYFDLLKMIIRTDQECRIYLDIKDTIGAPKVRQLREILQNNALDFDRKVIKRIQLVRSHEVELLQLADILIGAVMAANRGTTTSKAKLKVIERIKEKSNYSLTKTTLLQEPKMNIFIWQPNWGY